MKVVVAKQTMKDKQGESRDGGRGKPRPQERQC